MSKKSGRFLSLCIAILLLLGIVPVQAAGLPAASEPILTEPGEPIPGESALPPASGEMSAPPAVAETPAGVSAIAKSFESFSSSKIPDGIYAFKNLGNTDRWMDVERNSTVPGAHIQQYAYSKSPADAYSASGLFRITWVGVNRYIIRLMLNETLTFGISGGEIITKTIPAGDAEVSMQDTFYIVRSGNGYTLSPCGSGFLLSANNTTASGMAGAPDSFLVPRSPGGLTNQSVWIIEGYQSDIPDGVYAFLNMGNSARWMDTALNSVTPGARMQQYAFGSSPAGSFSRSGLFKVRRIGGSDLYTIRLMLHNNLSFGVSGSEILTKKISPIDGRVENESTFTIVFNNGGYLIRPYGSSYCIAANNTTASGSAGAPGSYLKPRTLAEAGDQARWTLERYTGSDQGGYTVVFPGGASSNLAVGDEISLSVIPWSTVPGANTPYMEVLAEDSNRVASQWNSSNHTVTLKAHQPGSVRISVQIRTSSTSAAAVQTLTPYTLSAHLLVEEGTYFFRNIDMDLFMQIDDDDEPGYSTSGAIMEQYKFDGGDYQRWELLHQNDGCYKIVSVRSGMALSVASANVNKNNLALVQESDQGLDRQLWKITKSSRGHYVLRPKSGETYSTDWCMSSGSGAIVQDGRDVEQRPYTDDSDLKDEWELYKIGSDVMYIAIMSDNSSHSHFSSYQSIFDCFKTTALEYNFMKTDYISVKSCLDQMESAKYFVSRSHGGHWIENNKECTLIQLSETNTSSMLRSYQIYDFETHTALVDFSKMELALFVGCETAYNTGDANKESADLPNATVKAGAKYAIGFTKSINCSAATSWTSAFFKNYALTQSVKLAAERAVDDAEDDNFFVGIVTELNVNSYKIYPEITD